MKFYGGWILFGLGFTAGVLVAILLILSFNMGVWSW